MKSNNRTTPIVNDGGMDESRNNQPSYGHRSRPVSNIPHQTISIHNDNFERGATLGDDSVGYENVSLDAENYGNEEENPVHHGLYSHSSISSGYTGDPCSGWDSKAFCTSNEERFALLDRAMNDIGIGNFHMLLFLSSAGSFMIEASEINLLSLLLPKFKTVWNATDLELSMITSSSNIGMIAGTIIFGQLSDLTGRRAVFHVTFTLFVIFGFLSSFSTNVTTFALSRLFMGFAYGGNTVNAATLMIETVPTNWRGAFSAVLSFAYTFGYVLTVLFAWAFIDPYGWQWLVRGLALVGIPTIFALFFIPESTRFCVQKRRYQQCVDIVGKIARYNNVPVPAYFTVEALEGREIEVMDSCEGPKEAKKKSIVKKLMEDTLHVFSIPPLKALLVVWFLNSFAHTIMVFLPLELESRFPDEDSAIYKVALALCLGALIGAVIVIFMSKTLQRLTELKVGLSILSVSILLVAVVPGPFGVIFFIVMIVHVGTNIVFHGLYTYTPEIFPTSFRVRCFSICQVGQRLGPVFAPFAIVGLSDISFELCGIVFSGVFALALLVSWVTLKQDTFGKPLVEENQKNSISVKPIDDEQKQTKDERIESPEST